MYNSYNDSPALLFILAMGVLSASEIEARRLAGQAKKLQRLAERAAATPSAANGVVEPLPYLDRQLHRFAAADVPPAKPFTILTWNVRSLKSNSKCQLVLI